MKIEQHSLVILVFICIVQASNYTDLNGFRLWQFKSSVQESMGEPDNVIKKTHSEINAYYFNDSCYMIFEYLDQNPEYLYSIQITGSPVSMIPFEGFTLGDSEKKVVEKFGKPDGIDTIAEPAVFAYVYDSLNYTFEFNSNLKLYSIKIYAHENIFKIKKGAERSTYNRFVKLLKKRALNKEFFDCFRPDMEIYNNDFTNNIWTKYSDFIKIPGEDIEGLLIGDKWSVLDEILKTEPVEEMRVIENFGIGQVFKFYDGAILEEIVFFPYKGEMRIYEIAFKDQFEALKSFNNEERCSYLIKEEPPISTEKKVRYNNRVKIWGEIDERSGVDVFLISGESRLYKKYLSFMMMFNGEKRAVLTDTYVNVTFSNGLKDSILCDGMRNDEGLVYLGVVYKDNPLFKSHEIIQVDIKGEKGPITVFFRKKDAQLILETINCFNALHD